MRQALWVSTIAVALLALLATVPSILGSGAAVTRAQSFSLEVDTDPAANTGDSLGPTDVCRQVSVGSFQVDVVAKDAPPLFGVELTLLYDPQVLRITAIQADGGLFLVKKQGSSLFNLSEPTPDEDGTYRAAASDINITGPSGSGTVFRLTLEAKAAGISPINIATDDPATPFNEGPVVPDTQGAPVTPLLAGGEVRVDQPCSGSAPAPTPPDEPTPDAGASPAPTPEDTTGEIGDTPQAGDGEAGTTPGTPQTNLIEDIGAQDSVLAVADATVFEPGDIIQIDDEKLRVISVSDDVLVVERGVEGTEAAEHDRGVTLSKVDSQIDEEPSDGEAGTDPSGDSGTDLLGMPWVAVWATLGGLAVAGGGAALFRLRLRRMR